MWFYSNYLPLNFPLFVNRKIDVNVFYKMTSSIVRDVPQQCTIVIIFLSPHLVFQKSTLLSNAVDFRRVSYQLKHHFHEKAVTLEISQLYFNRFNQMSTFILKNTACYGLFHIHFREWNILIVADPTVTVKCRTVIEVLFLYFTLYPSAMLDSHPFTYISFPNNKS